MSRPFSSFPMGALLFLAGGIFLPAQTPAPLTRAEKEAAAAVQAPQPLALPPLPGQLQGAPAAAAAPAPAAALPRTLRPAGAAPALVHPVADTPLPSGSSLSKMQALEAVTQEPAVKLVPRVSAPADKLPVTTSTSTSGQFIVHGKVFETRSAMSSRCEEISQELRKVLNDKEPHVLPIVVLLNTGEDAFKSKGQAVTTAITELSHGGFHLQVTVNERPGLTAADLRMAVVRALLAERILRNHQKIVTPEGRLLLPDWVMTGVLHAMDYKASPRPSAIFAAIFRSGKIYGIEEIIAASPVEMDGLSRSIYETSCCALVLALVDQPEGSQRFNKFLNSLASDPRSERELLDAAFPKFAASASSLNKWWSLQLATLSKPGIAEPFTAADSLKAIEDAILIRYAATPDEVPQNVKQRPFGLPPPLFVKPAAPPPPVAARQMDDPPASRPAREKERQVTEKAPAPATASGSAAAVPSPEAEAENGDAKRPLWRRMLFLGASKEEAQTAEEQAAAATPASSAEGAAEDKPGFFGRLLGADKKDGAAEPAATPPPPQQPVSTPAPAPASPAAKPKAQERPAAKSAPAQPQPPAPPPPVEEDKPSKLNPLNWFRGGKKPAAEPQNEAPPPAQGKDGQASLSLPAPQEMNFARLLSPALADAWQALAPAAPRQTVDILNFFKRKPKEEDAPKEQPPSPPGANAPQSPASAGAAAPVRKPAAKPPARKPRTSNPNSTPAARPKPVPSGGQRTTNPNAKPVPAQAVPQAQAQMPAASESGLVPVILPLEEYKLILKRPDRGEILDRNLATLRALDLRVGTLFRPVVLAYLSLFTDLKEGKTKDMDKRIAAVREFALVAYQKTVAVRDYLDFYEANESSGLSGKFDDYLNLPAIIQQELPPREDPISKYLDAIDKEFSE